MHTLEKADDIKVCLKKFYDKIKECPRHRFRSWEHCYKYFQSIEKPGFDEVKELQKIYADNLKNSLIKGKERKEFVSVMFVSKLLLATYGCIPAFDQYVCQGMGRSISSQINEKTLRYVYDFARLNKKDLLAEKARIEKQCGCEQPMMKLVDAYLWVKGQESKNK